MQQQERPEGLLSSLLFPALLVQDVLGKKKIGLGARQTCVEILTVIFLIVRSACLVSLSFSFLVCETGILIAFC